MTAAYERGQRYEPIKWANIGSTVNMETSELEVLLPVHNEAETIEGTMREIYSKLSPRVSLRFIVCEDGSLDESRNELIRLGQSLPIKLVSSAARKGYARAVIDGMKILEADYLLCLDSDGQCDPNDFGKFWDERKSQDVAIGWRIHRADNLLRRGLSRSFYVVYRLFNRVPVHDPSCPFVLAPRRVIESVLPEMGEMEQGFWWEFIARVHRRGFSIREFPVNHRKRPRGATQVYSLPRLPGIAWRHSVALFRMWLQGKGKS